MSAGAPRRCTSPRDRVPARVAVAQAISQLNRVDRRLLAMFWHLAERWGRVTADGTAIPLTRSRCWSRDPTVRRQSFADQVT
jgi:hypothetical protein